jgi:hypothetical protein
MNPIRTTSYTSGTRFLRTLPPDHHRAFANHVPEAVTVEIAEAGHYVHETDSTKLLDPMQIFWPRRCHSSTPRRPGWTGSPICPKLRRPARTGAAQ